MSPRSARAFPAALFATVLLLAGCSSSEDKPPSEEPEVQATPLSEWDASSVVITRTDFCDFVPEEAIAAAVGQVSSTDHYGNGSEIEVGDGDDLAHEYGCSWTGDQGTAQAWVFVPQITKARAKALVKAHRATQGCRVIDGADRAGGAGFGDPGIGTLCTADGDVEASYRGLFVDSWLTCTLQRPQAKEQRLVDLTGEWCVAAAKAAGANS